MSDDIVTRLRGQYVNNFNALLWDEAADEIERLRAERDEARREICRRAFQNPEWQKDFARGRGWDCFKEVQHD